MPSNRSRQNPPAERAVLVGLEFARRSAAPEDPALAYSASESLEELRELARSAGAEVVHSTIQHLNTPNAATLIGAGKVEELALLRETEEIGVFLFDVELSPTQQRNLERRLGAKVIDRTQLILDIFAGRAQTREGKLQVELAQLDYLLPRLAGRGAEMSRLGGGIGTRGPGETQLETDRRKIARRMRKVETDLEAVRRGRGVQRAKRASVPLATAALVGYTNAGKSTLFNTLTRAGVLADNRLFATLDPTVRALTLPSRRRVLLSDTVGFIRNLPISLVKAFRATLEEAAGSSILVHVVDASSEHAAAHAAHVNEVLKEIGAGGIPRILALNKTDLLPDGGSLLAQRFSAEPESAHCIAVSAINGTGLEELLTRLDEMLPYDPLRRVRFHFPHEAAAQVNAVHVAAQVLHREYTPDGCEMEAIAPASLIRVLTPYLVEEQTGAGPRAE
ncbi:MAG: GTPase HflX [Bryobacterales bacterium]|nr:GTPase HflX [Bryobacterales bacterium]